MPNPTKPRTNLQAKKQAAEAAPSAITSRDRIVTGILDDIFGGKHEPGARLITDRLANQFGVSQTPIREAIGTLVGMGVLEVKPNCGAIVRRFATREVRDICQVRHALECQAILSACGRIDRTELKFLRTTFTRLSKINRKIRATEIKEVKDSDTLLHNLIRNANRNAFLAGELDRMMILVRAIRDAAWNRLLNEDSPDLNFVMQEAKEHLAIVEALLANDRKAARRALSDHLRSGARYIVRAVED